jgi:hypothetical protein
MNFRPSTLVIGAAVLAGAAGALWMFTSNTVPSLPAMRPEPLAQNLPVPIEPIAVAMPAPEIPPDQPPPKPPVVISPEALREMNDVQFMLRDFRTRLGGNPEGTNAEIMQAVMGGNRVNARLGPPEGQKVNEEGELLDRWGAPYFFHQLSLNEMEIRSAGPDRAMWTSDDIVVK